jgi:flagellar assembly protein FliH
MSSSKLIRDSALATKAVAWQAPDVVALADEVPEIDPEQVRREAYEQGFAQGQAEGFATGSARVNAQIEALDRVLSLFTEPMANLDHRVEEEIVLLIKAIAQRLLRREIKTDASHIAGVVREGLAALPIADEQITLRLHANDAATVEEYLGGSDGQRRWKIEVDPTVDPGGCLIFNANSQIDGSLETRLTRLIATMFEDDRKSVDDNGEPSDD